MKNKLYYTAPEVERVEIRMEGCVLTVSPGSNVEGIQNVRSGSWDADE